MHARAGGKLVALSTASRANRLAHPVVSKTSKSFKLALERDDHAALASPKSLKSPQDRNVHVTVGTGMAAPARLEAQDRAFLGLVTHVKQDARKGPYDAVGQLKMRTIMTCANH